MQSNYLAYMQCVLGGYAAFFMGQKSMMLLTWPMKKSPIQLAGVKVSCIHRFSGLIVRNVLMESTQSFRNETSDLSNENLCCHLNTCLNCMFYRYSMSMSLDFFNRSTCFCEQSWRASWGRSSKSSRKVVTVMKDLCCVSQSASEMTWWDKHILLEFSLTRHKYCVCPWAVVQIYHFVLVPEILETQDEILKMYNKIQALTDKSESKLTGEFKEAPNNPGFLFHIIFALCTQKL